MVIKIAKRRKLTKKREYKKKDLKDFWGLKIKYYKRLHCGFKIKYFKLTYIIVYAKKNIVKTLLALAATTLINNTNLMDASKNCDMDFQEPATPVMEGIISFTNNLLVIMCLL